MRAPVNRKLLALFAALALFAGIGSVTTRPVSGQQQPNGVSQGFTLGNGPSPVYNILGYSSCALVVDTINGATIKAYVTSAFQPNLSSQWTAATNLGSSGVITTTGQSAGNVAGQGLTGFYFVVSGLSGSNQVSGSIACTIANGLGSGGVSFPYSAATAQPTTAASFIGTGGIYSGTFFPFSMDSSGRLIISPTGLPTPLAVQPVSYSSGTFPVTGTFWQATQPVSGTVTVNAGTGFPTPIPTPAGGTYPVTLPTGTGSIAAMQLCNTATNCTGFFSDSSAGTGVGNSIAGVAAVMKAYAPANSNTYDVYADPAGAALRVTTGGAFATPVPAATAGPGAVKASAGRLVRLLVTTAGSTGAFTCYDNASSASGTVIGAISATNGASVGYTVELNMPAANGIFCVSAASGPAVTVSYY